MRGYSDLMGDEAAPDSPPSGDTAAHPLSGAVGVLLAAGGFAGAYGTLMTVLFAMQL